MKLNTIIKIVGTVVHGSKDGFKIGFPTANIELIEPLDLDNGVYASKIKINGSMYPSITHYGPRLIFGETFPLLEVHIFDFNNEIYGQTVEVYLIEFIRETKNFEGIERLIEQIEKDCNEAKLILELDIKEGHNTGTA